MHSVKSVRIRTYSGPHFSAFGLEQLRIMRTRISPNADTFYAVIKTGSFLSSCIAYILELVNSGFLVLRSKLTITVKINI